MSAWLAGMLARHRTISVAGLAALVVMAWAWVLTGAGTAMTPQFSLTPAGTGGTAMAGMAMDRPAPWSPGHALAGFSMWWTMMVAMMLPSAAPTILLYGRVAAGGPAPSDAAVGAFLSGYLIMWGFFSALATLAQGLLEATAYLSAANLASRDGRLSGAILVGAGAYQLSPMKQACLRHCQSPAGFLARHYRAGTLGAVRMGALHGAICIGCCWSLMAILFVGGVMNLAWIALLAIMVAAEKLLPFGRAIAMALGVACLAGGGLMLTIGRT